MSHKYSYKIAFSTLGCKANYVDTEALIARCRRAGLEIVDFEEDADIHVVNTCTVTSVALGQSRQLLRRPRRTGKPTIVVAAGCAGEVSRESLESCNPDAIFGTKEREKLFSFILERARVPGPSGEDHAPLPQSRARAFLKIQDGCNRRCSYCIVPYARGAAISFPPDEIERRCEELSAHHNEIVLTGIDIGQYAWKEICGSRSINLASLLERLLENSAISRIRLSSLDPMSANDRIVSLMERHAKLCRHVHLSIQSGSGAILRSMGRTYSPNDVEEIALELASRVPGIALTGDIIAGFPGEGEAEHLESIRLVEKLPLASLHVFPYSLREGTRAAGMRGQLQSCEKKKRARELRLLAEKKRHAFLHSQTGLPLNCIVTSRAA
nr:MiaB/RimO family radical SAM methylthiotransferase [bacterium]